ncbi:MAG: hypothetical protein R3362_13255 [Rhodothermales bacterium]|nr:hypothetical protein [Rhodothermales bacterium]
MHPRIQLLTAEELLSGAGIDLPAARHQRATFKQAPRARRPDATQGDLGL